MPNGTRSPRTLPAVCLDEVRSIERTLENVEGCWILLVPSDRECRPRRSRLGPLPTAAHHLESPSKFNGDDQDAFGRTPSPRRRSIPTRIPRALFSSRRRHRFYTGRRFYSSILVAAKVLPLAFQESAPRRYSVSPSRRRIAGATLKS